MRWERPFLAWLKVFRLFSVVRNLTVSPRSISLGNDWQVWMASHISIIETRKWDDAADSGRAVIIYFPFWLRLLHLRFWENTLSSRKRKLFSSPLFPFFFHTHSALCVKVPTNVFFRARVCKNNRIIFSMKTSNDFRAFFDNSNSMVEPGTTRSVAASLAIRRRERIVLPDNYVVAPKSLDGISKLEAETRGNKQKRVKTFAGEWSNNCFQPKRLAQAVSNAGKKPFFELTLSRSSPLKKRIANGNFFIRQVCSDQLRVCTQKKDFFSSSKSGFFCSSCSNFTKRSLVQTDDYLLSE